MNVLARIIIDCIRVYELVLLVYAILTWIPDAGRIRYYFEEVVRPVLEPVERILPYALKPFSLLIVYFLLELIMIPLYMIL